MNQEQRQPARSRLQPPRQDRTVLIEPPFEGIAEIVAGNVRLRAGFDCVLLDRSFSDIALQARIELLDAARTWTAAYRDVAATSPDPHGMIFLAGHQPQMFHPGVWFKNFVLDAAAKRLGATAINLLVDGDILTQASVHVPGGSAIEPNTTPIAFDCDDPGIPFEDRRIEDRELFNSFGHRAMEKIQSLVADPLLNKYWPLAQSRAKQTDNLGTSLAQARHQLEGDWGLETLEVPLSRLCRGEAFSRFAAYLLARLPEFHRIYNESLQEYRRLHRVRNASHPAPDLAKDGEWLETPFWVWTADDPRRRHLFARTTSSEMILTDRKMWECSLPLHAEGNAARAVERLVELQQENVRIRPRALITTLWARLGLGDLFIHGIGGAKYDEVTDRLIERFFSLKAPQFMVASATLHLPIARERLTLDTPEAIERKLREMTYHPERFLTAEALAGCADAIAEKRRWIATPQERQNAKNRCRAIRAVNAALQPLLDDRRKQLAEQLALVVHQTDAEHILSWREYAFCLYPEPTLRSFLFESIPGCPTVG